jgi:hypothetical protein
MRLADRLAGQHPMKYRSLALSVLAVAMGYWVTQATAEEPQKVMPRLSVAMAQRLASDPRAMAELLARLPTIPPAPTVPEPPSSPWQTIVDPFAPGGASNPLLLTDGSVLVHANCTTAWERLVPDIHGNYVNGTWSPIAPLPSGYQPRFFSSEVLPDGRVIVEGGEYDGCAAVRTNKGAIYDPPTNKWTSVSPPSGWSTIGDAQSVVLANLTYMQANCCTRQAALLNAKTLTWTDTGADKFDDNNEEGWGLLPDTSVLTVDAFAPITVFLACGRHTERYAAKTGTWSSAGNTPKQLADCQNPGNSPSFEVGPQILRPDGTVVAFAGTTCSSMNNSHCDSGVLSVVSRTAIYNSTTRKWNAGPDLPKVAGRYYTLDDAPAALEPNGKVLFAASPNYLRFVKPTHFFEFSTSNTIAQVADNADGPITPSYFWNFLVLPTGQILATDLSNQIWMFTPSGSAKSSWAPKITSFPATIFRGTTYLLKGLQLNGLSQGTAYGDDAQANTSYPIVRVVNKATGHVFYARTTNPTTTSIAPNTASSVDFVLPKSAETGAGSLYVVANGIPSAAVAVTVY